ncbi:putative DUF2407 ubiquitin-like domain containing protein [Lyophyllum shimeji]|uniref:DUF2407 ubiquitin-like domain containing protein n=1 Tax=Lyophyllum shimeji TaxID=47721 RepID=A0A9P3PFF5_LYOSH|nr:putative DUF2407 ubiquitin-like domain containing protein [Lyophyllum shimeji]
MSEEAPAPEIQINVKGPSELKLQISITTDKTVLELKQAIAGKSDVEAERQRLIYSGRVLKVRLAPPPTLSSCADPALPPQDEDALSIYKIQSGHTIHMVKGVARAGAAGGAAAAPTPQQLPPMQTGQNVHDPLTQLNGVQGFGALAGLNPFADMGVNPSDPNMMQTLMSNPQFLQQMSAMMSNPQVMDQIIALNPQLANFAPQARQMFQSEHFRQIISDPQRLQQMLQLASALGGNNPLAPPPASSFPAPGTPGAAPSTTTTPATPPTPAANPFSLFGGAGAGAGAGGANPFGMDPATMQQLMAGFGGFGGGAGAGFGAPPAAPADTRPPEERFQVQLQQLQDMGFTNASQNIRALLATGGNVHSAIEYILGGGGL